MSERTALYRLYDAAGRLLYVGVATRPERRWRTHECEKHWWPEVARKSVDWYPARDSALAAESRAILDERPTYNVMTPDGTGRMRMRRDAPPDAWQSRRPHWEVRYG